MKKKNIIIFARNIDFVKDIYLKLNNNLKNKYKIKKIFTKPKNITEINKKFFNCESINEYINEFNFNNIIKNKKYYIDEKVISKFLKVEKVFNYMLDFYESDSYRYTNVEKRSLYFSLLNQVINFFKENKVDIIFFSHNPHDLVDVLILETSKILNIKCIFVRGFPIINHFKFDSNKEKKDKITNFKNTELTLKEINKITKKFNNLDRENKKYQNYFLIKSNIVKYNFFNFNYFIFYLFSSLKYFINILKILFKLLFLNEKLIFKNYIKFKDKKQINKFDFETIILKNNLKKFRLLDYLYKCKKPFNSKQKYILLPLWFQPSSTSYPFSGDYLNYEILINMVYDVMPKNYNLIIKESPDIFNLNRNAWFRGPFVRKKNFYKKFINKERIHFADIQANDYELIKKSEFICGLADLYTFSSFMNHKKIIIFGDNLFPEVHGIKFCHSKDDLRNSINIHLKSRSINKNDIKKFVNKINENVFYNEFNFFQKKKIVNYDKIAELYKKILI